MQEVLPRYPESMKKYSHAAIEKKWQKKWAKTGLYVSREKGKKKKFVLDMFPYPSGDGLHVGHPKGYIATDVFSRHARMQGYSVLHPMGWDAFGLPAENYAIKNKVHPRKAVEKNVKRFKQQLQMIGLDYDWKREINTTDPGYYKWTQWIFLQLLKKGLAYQSFEPINWCPSCQTGLANEDLEDGKCERCGSVVEQKPMRQWVLKITDYADRLLEDLSLLPEWQEHIKESQRNWIGRSEGAEIDFFLDYGDEKVDARVGSDGKKAHITVFTTRADTLFGATYLVLAPEHEWVRLALTHKGLLQNEKDVVAYVQATKNKTDLERQESKEKTGVELKGVSAINPATGEKIPMYIADYVLAHYGTGAIMAVPAHDERDLEFAQKFGLPIRNVVSGRSKDDSAYAGAGNLLESGAYTGMAASEARSKMITSFGIQKTTYKLRDWVFSRQRYWGEPIPVIHCGKCGAVAVPEKDLPVKLPEVKNYAPTGTGESPLAAIEKWVNVKCPKCKGKARRETNTMPQWAGSSWYYLRYMDPKNKKALVDKKKEKYWAPVDMYVGGAEHATRHLIYARFWHKFLYDIKVVSTKEPFTRLISVGLIQAEDGRKMSKRFGNVINPDDIIKVYGADTLRLYEMFMGPFTDAIAWNTKSMIGTRRFIERVWRIGQSIASGSQSAAHADVEQELHKTIKKVGEDIQSFKFNTAISQMMIFLNVAEKSGVTKAQFTTFLKLLAPFAPHIAEELWAEGKNKGSIHVAQWPQLDLKKLVSDTVTIVVQVGGKPRAQIVVPQGATEAEVRPNAEKEVAKWLEGATIRRFIYVPNRVINFVI